MLKDILGRNPKKAIFIANLIFLFSLDFFTANIYKFVMGYPWSVKEREGNQLIRQFRENEKKYRIYSPLYHHDLDKNKFVENAVWTEGPYSVYTNSLGFRDASCRGIELNTEKYRIIFIGDSFTEGAGVNYQHTFVGLISKALSKRGIEVLNAAVSSYCPVIYWRKIKYLIEEVKLKFDELIVFIDISDIQDEAIDYCLDKNGDNIIGKETHKKAAILPSKLAGFIKNNTIFTYTVLKTTTDMLNFFKYHKYKREIKRYGFHDFKRSAWTIDERIYREYAASGLREAALHMDMLQVLLKKHNIKLAVAVYPWPIQILQGDLDSVQATFWRDWCKSHNAEFLDYSPFFVIGKTTEERLTILNKYFFRNNVHWNKHGHQFVAWIFLSWFDGGSAD